MTTTTRTRKAATPKVDVQDTPAPTQAVTPAAPTAPQPVACGCGCGEMANLGRQYRPGHDARHAGQVARAVIAKEEGALDRLAALAPKLQAKAQGMIDRDSKKAAEKALRAEIRAAAKAELDAKLAAL